MLGRVTAPARRLVSMKPSPWKTRKAGFARNRGGGGGKKGVLDSRTSAALGALSVEEMWVEVKDEASGQIYWWNTETDETTELGAPRPTGVYAPITDVGQSSGQPGILGMVAQGFALGTGASLASHAIHGIFGGSGDGGGGAGDVGGTDQGNFTGQDSNDDGSWDV